MRAYTFPVLAGAVAAAACASSVVASNGQGGTYNLPCRMLDVSSEAADQKGSRSALTDGNTDAGTGWSSGEHASPDHEEWCSMLLDDWYVVTGVTLWSAHDSGRGLPVDFKVQFSTDLGRSWYDIPSARVKGFSPGAGRRRVAIDFPEVVARGLRVQATRLSAVEEGRYALRLAEVQAAGSREPGPFRSSVSGELDADLNNYWRFFGRGLHRNDMNEPMLWGLKWWGTADASCCDWAEMKLYWHADAADRASFRHWLRSLPIDPDGYVWATENHRRHLGQHQLFHTSADFINKLWECYRWEGGREMLTAVPDYGIGIVDTGGEPHDFCSPDVFLHRLAGEGLVIAQTFEVPTEFQAVRARLQVSENSIYELRCFDHVENRLIASRVFNGLEDHAQSWTTLELPETQEAGEYRLELLNRAPQLEGRPAVFWTHPVGWYSSELDVYADGTSGLNGLLDLGLLDKARLAMRHLLDVEGMRGRSEGIVLITHPEHTGRPAKTLERTGASMPSTYYDLVRSGYKEAFVNNRYLKALESMARLERAAGNAPQAEQLAQHLTDARAAFHRTFWNSDTGRYAGWIDERGKKWDYGEVVVNLEAILRGAAPRESARSILDWISGQRMVEGDDAKGADIYFWGFAPRKNTLGYESAGELNHWWGGWFYDLRPNHRGRGNFGNQEENGGTNPFISYYDVMARLAVDGADAAWRRFCADPRSLMSDFHRDLFYRPPPADPDHPGEHYQAYVMSLPECGLPLMAVIRGFMGIEPDGETLYIQPRLPRRVNLLAVGELGFCGREYRVEVRPDRLTLVPGSGDSRELAVAVGNLLPETTYIARACYSGSHRPTVTRFKTDAAGRGSLVWSIDPSASLCIEPEP